MLREFRERVWKFLIPLYREIYGGLWIQCLPDRFCDRVFEWAVSSESWHRDVSLTYTPDVIGIFGGWINLNKEGPAENTQYFSCIPKSHHNAVEVRKGFDKLTPGEIEHYTNHFRKEKIAVPPGHIIIFNEKLVHEVAGTKNYSPAQREAIRWPKPIPWDYGHSFRLFTKVLISRKPMHVFGPALFQWLRDQAILPYHHHRAVGGQEEEFGWPPMYSTNHPGLEAKTHQLEIFSSHVKAEFLQGSSEPRAKHPEWVFRFMPSLASRGMKFPNYTAEEMEIFKPIKMGNEEHLQSYDPNMTWF